MITTARSLPKRCAGCGSFELDGPAAAGRGNSVCCRSCGLLIIINGNPSLASDDPDENLEDLELNADFAVCPHCHTVDEFMVVGGEVWCDFCGLDPNVKDYPSEEIAHLWRDGTVIQQVMVTSSKMLEPHKPVGKFVRNKCGAKCVRADGCNQRVSDFLRCFRKEKEAKCNTGEEMGKRRNRKKNQQRRIEKAKQAPQIAAVVCATGGWFAERFYDKLTYSEQPRTTGGRSRTQGVPE